MVPCLPHSDMFWLCMVKQENVLTHLPSWRLRYTSLWFLPLGFCTLLLQTKSTCPWHTLTQVCLRFPFLSLSLSMCMYMCMCTHVHVIMHMCMCVCILPSCFPFSAFSTASCALWGTSFWIFLSRSFHPPLSLSKARYPSLDFSKMDPYMCLVRKKVLYYIHLPQKVRIDECK